MERPPLELARPISPFLAIKTWSSAWRPAAAGPRHVMSHTAPRAHPQSSRNTRPEGRVDAKVGLVPSSAFLAAARDPSPNAAGASAHRRDLVKAPRNDPPLGPVASELRHSHLCGLHGWRLRQHLVSGETQMPAQQLSRKPFCQQVSRICFSRHLPDGQLILCYFLVRVPVCERDANIWNWRAHSRARACL